MRGQDTRKMVKAVKSSHPSTETLRNEYYQNQLCQNSGKQLKVYSNQGNTESRKRQLQNGRKALWHFYWPLSHTLPSLAAHLLYVKAIVPDSRGSRADIISKLLCLFYPDGGYLKDWHKAFVSIWGKRLQLRHIIDH